LAASTVGPVDAAPMAARAERTTFALVLIAYPRTSQATEVDEVTALLR
jgi:hypothetical protein